jgi:hypothetical protein
MNAFQRGLNSIVKTSHHETNSSVCAGDRDQRQSGGLPDVATDDVATDDVVTPGEAMQ